MSRVAGTQYTIGSSTRRCAATERELGTGERFVAALVQHPEEDAYVRLDYSEQAWNEGARPMRPLVLYGFWRGLVPDPTAKKRLLIDDQSLVELFEQSGEAIDVEGAEQSSEKERLGFRFVLALILLRKRLLVQEGSKGTTMLVRARGVPKPPEGPELMEVVDPGLDAGTIAKVTGMLGAVISGETGPATGGSVEKGRGE
jgi:hypothetical protein